MKRNKTPVDIEIQEWRIAGALLGEIQKGERFYRGGINLLRLRNRLRSEINSKIFEVGDEIHRLETELQKLSEEHALLTGDQLEKMLYADWRRIAESLKAHLSLRDLP